MKKKLFLSLPVVIHEKSLWRWKCRDFFIPGAPWGQPELQSPNRCYLSCDDWQTISFSFNQSSVPAPSLSLSPGITNGKWSILEHHGALWTFLRGAINITSFAAGLCETLCKVSRLIFPVVNCQNLCCNRTMFTLKFIQTGFIHSIMHSERMLHTFKSS